MVAEGPRAEIEVSRPARVTGFFRMGYSDTS